MFVEYVFSAIPKMQVVKAASVWGDFLETHTPQSTHHKPQSTKHKT